MLGMEGEGGILRGEEGTPYEQPQQPCGVQGRDAVGGVCGGHGGRCARLYAGEPGNPSEGVRFRLPAVLPAEPEALPPDRGAGARADRASGVGAGGRHSNGPAFAYRVYRDGVLEAEVPDIAEYWRDDMVSFLLGCSFTFEEALMRAQIPMRHIEQGSNVSMYVTNIDTQSAGVFSGPMVVSMRPVAHSQVVKAVQVTSRYPDVHGAPIHVGEPGAIGIKDISKPDYGDPVEFKENETPVFWACGVTPQAVAEKSRPSLMITHAPGYMFVTDIPNETTAAL